MRILFLAALAIGSQLLALGWRNRAFQIAAGLGGYSLLWLPAMILYCHLNPSEAAGVRDILQLGYCGVLFYWLACFARPEQPQHSVRSLHS